MYIMKYYSAIQRNELLVHTTIWWASNIYGKRENIDKKGFTVWLH